MNAEVSTRVCIPLPVDTGRIRLQTALAEAHLPAVASLNAPGLTKMVQTVRPLCVSSPPSLET